MHSQYNFKQKQKDLSKQKLRNGYRSLSLLNRSKQNNQSQPKVFSKNKNNRVATESKQSNKYKQASVKAKHSVSKLNSLVKNNDVGSMRYQRYDNLDDDMNPSIQVQNMQQTIEMQAKLSKEWINKSLPILSAQALYEQNHQLKRQINNLREQNSKLNSKLLIQKKQRDRLTNQLNLQKEYYNYYERYDLLDQSNAQVKNKNHKYKPTTNNKYGFHPVNYMITGIKFRYQKLKEQHQKKCLQIQQMLKNTDLTQIQEIIHCNKILNRENLKLIDKLNNITQLFVQGDSQQSSRIIQQNCFKSLKFQTANPKQRAQIIYSLSSNQNQSQYPPNIQKYTKNTASLQQKNQKTQNQLHMKNETIKKLQKTITLLDNEVYHKKKQLTRSIKNQKQIHLKIAFIQKQNIKIKQNCEKQIQNNKRLSQKMYEQERKIFQKQIIVKNQKIAKLQKEVSYLSTLLKYWKPLGQKQQPEHHESDKVQKLDSQESNSLRKSSVMISNRKRTKTKISQNEKSNQEFKLGLKQPVLSLKVSEFEDGQSVEGSEQQELKEPKTSRQKHSAGGCKARKINPLQIQYLKEQIKYRCMVRRLRIQEIRGYFNFRVQRNQNLSKRQNEWKQKYMTMRDLKQILVDSPFLLTAQQSHKFARFIVQDTSAEHVFCDQQNQIEREIVKSIIKAFIGQYNLPNIERCKIQLQNILVSYGKNLKLALQSLSDHGIISSYKLFGLLESLGIDISEDLKNQTISKLYQKSNPSDRSINTLKYEYMFQKDFIE